MIREAFFPGVTGPAYKGTLKTLAQFKGLLASDPAAGGYLVADSALEEMLIQEAYASAMRRLARILPPIGRGQAITIPSEETAPDDAAWSTELSDGDEDTATPYGRRRLDPVPLRKFAKATRDFAASPNAAQWYLERLGRAAGSAEEEGFVNGSGVGEPLGVLSAGITEVETAAATTLAIADVKIWRYSLPASYQANARILCNKDFLAAMSQLDTTGVLGLDRGVILNAPFALSDAFPSRGTNPASQTAGPVAVIGDFGTGYYIQDGAEPVIQRLSELYAEANQIGWILDRASDGAVVIKDAFRVLSIKV